MKLPKLPEMNFEVNDNSSVKETKNVKETKKKEKEMPKKSIIPKTEYDDTGKPILAIPDLNDVDLSAEIDKFFGKGGV